jgi:hypothetical protein
MVKNLLLCVLFIAALFVAGCGESYIRFFTGQKVLKPDANDVNTPVGFIEAKGSAADTLAKQFAANIQTEEGRLADLFKYNSWMFMVLFFVLIGGVVFAVLTKSSWSWIIPTAAGGGLMLLVFITQATVYIKYIGLGIVVIALGVLIYKAWQYQSERNALTAAAAAKEKTV